MYDNAHHPYPSRQEKKTLANLTNLTTVKSWAMCAAECQLSHKRAPLCSPASLPKFQRVRSGCYAPTAIFSSSRMRALAIILADGGAQLTGCPPQKQVTTWFNNARKSLVHQR